MTLRITYYILGSLGTPETLSWTPGSLGTWHSLGTSDKLGSLWGIEALARPILCSCLLFSGAW